MPLNNLSLHFLEKHPRESAKALQDFPAAELAEYFSALPDPVTANILACFIPADAIACLAKMEVSRAGRILEQMGVDVAARLLRSMQQEMQAGLIAAVSPGYAHRLKSVLRYPNGTVGQYMSPNIFVVSQDMHASEIFSAARNATSELQGEIFIVDDKQHLVGLIDIKTLISADPREEVQHLMISPEPAINARTNIDYVKEHPAWQDREALPVIDHNYMFVGVLKRKVMNEVLKITVDQDKEQTDLPGMLMTVVEMFWEIYAGLITPKYDVERQGRENDNR